MYSHLSSSHPIIIFIFISLLILPPHHAQDFKTYYLNCNKTFTCGQRIREIKYPFWGGDRPWYCGLPELKLSCKNDEFAVLEMGSDKMFQVIDINQPSHEINMKRGDLKADICPSDSEIISTELNETLFYSGEKTEDLRVFYNCSSGLKVTEQNSSIRSNFTCSIGELGPKTVAFFRNEFSLVNYQNLESCKYKTRVLVNKMVLEEFKKNATMEVQELLNPSFIVKYRFNDSTCSACVNSGGLCWYGLNYTNKCLCHDRESSDPCPKFQQENPGTKMIVGLKIALVVASIILGVALIAIAFCIYNRRKKAGNGSSLISRNISSYPPSISDSEKGGTYMGVPIFSYTELQKATNNFDSSREVGDGGFGSVYKGKLQDGRVVAIKRLYEHNYKRVEQFMNEIEILTNLRHKHLVPLYGCTSQNCRQLLLVYEYVPNGTIADHLYGDRAKPGSLTWKTRLSIAIQTASALSYLHASHVVHRDVKTTNILLDNNFCVKVADFGLSRLFPLNATHVSTAPQGTPGYVDPEYHECYQLNHKSDVYSFGVVLIELISSMPAVDITRNRHEINLSNMAIIKIQNDALQELVDPNLGFESDYEVRKMITEVAELAFQCLHNGRELRPSMKDVLKVLIRIQSKHYESVNVDLLGDDAVLLNNNSKIVSPDSVTLNWVSRSTSSSTT